MLIPEWTNPKAIALVWPEHLKAGRAKLVKFYKDFTNLLSEHVPVCVLFSEGEKEFTPPGFLKANTKINVIPFSEIGDIWLKDYAPFFITRGKRLKPIRGEYEPSYLRTDAEKCYGNADNFLGDQIAKRICNLESMKLTLNGEPIKLDGGNLIWNSIGTAILSNRIITDNEHLFVEEIEKTLMEQLGIKELHVIPTEPGDDTGHVDGVVRFLDDYTILVSDYPYVLKDERSYIERDEYDKSKKYVDSIADYFKDKGYKVFLMPNDIPENSEKFETAVGNYVNYLRVGNKFFLPQYGTGREEKDMNAIAALEKAGIDRSNIIQVPQCNGLAQLGGVLNCITAHMHCELKIKEHSK